MSITPELYEFIVKVVEDKVRDIRVAREEFEKLTSAVRELAEAQRLTEERVGKLEEAVMSLAEAQARTEARVDRLEAALGRLAEAQRRTEERLNELAEAQKRTEDRLAELEKAMTKLAEAQKRTEERIDALAEAQRRTEERINELAEAQRKTEEALAQLSRAVGALSDTLGFGLEDLARTLLPSWLKEELNVSVGELARAFFETREGLVEVNLYGEGEREGAKVIVLGEATSKIRAGDVRRFLRKASLVKPLLPPSVELLYVMFGYYIHPSALEVAEAEQVHLVASYMGPTKVFRGRSSGEGHE